VPDRRYVLAGLAILLVAATYPSWRAAALGTRPLPPVLTAARLSPCILPPARMRASHMRLLSEWRDLAVRGGVRRVKMADGKTWNPSLSGTCLDCHEKAKFCDTCHEFAGAKPECWRCHVVPGGGS